MREMGKSFAYCDNCEKEISKPKRKRLESMHYNVWFVVILSSLGLAIIPFLIYRYAILKKNRCPNCDSQLEFFESREDIPEPKAQITRILKAIEDEKKENEKESFFCPYCQKEMNEQEEICPNCGTNLKE